HGHQLGRRPKANRLVAQTLCQCLALDELLDEVIRAIIGLSCLVHSDDARVLQLRSASGFAQEPVDVVAARQAPRSKDLDGHRAVELGIDRAPYAAKRAGPQLLEQLEL